MPAARPLVERFWEKVDIRDADECWPWTGAINSGGYGSIGVGRTTATASRLALEFSGQPAPTGGHACHTCDNRRCCNPNHLYWGDNASNMLDKKERGRTNPVTGDAHWLRRHPERAKPFNTKETAARGERNGNASISAETARVVVQRVANGESAYAVAKSLQMTFSTVNRICHGSIRAGDTDPELRVLASASIENNPRARKGLTDEQVRSIRQRSAAGESQARIGTHFGVSQTLVWQVLTGRVYKHVV